MDFLTQPFEAIRVLTPLEMVIRIVLAVLLGGIVGMERGIKNKAAGLRTFILVSLGSAIIMMTNQYIHQIYGEGDPVRMGAQVVSGIGFLGAGTIMVTTKNQIKGLTTAASLWGVAANGMAVGIGAYELAILGGVMLYLTMEVVIRLDLYIRNKSKIIDIYVEIDKKTPLDTIRQKLSEKNISIHKMEYITDKNPHDSVSPLIVGIPVTEKYSFEDLCALIESIEGVIYTERV
ncbi:MgtC/SapB family protein [Streptococcus rifensis]